MASIWAHFASESACLYHRVLMPFRFCGPEFAKYGWDFLAGEGFPTGHDVYLIHGLPTPQAIWELTKRKREGARIVWSVDDDWLSIPAWNPASPGADGMVAYELMKRLADHILTSTPALRDTFADLSLTTGKVLCAPNLLDVARFPKPDGREEDGVWHMTCADKVKLPVRVVWAGGPTHSGDVEVLTDVLDKLMSKFGPDKVIVGHFGPLPPPKLVAKYLYGGSLIHQPMVPFAAYQSILNSIDAHVYLCPLAPIPFNLSKSAIRVFEAWSLCAAPVATDHGEYSCIRNGYDGRLVQSADQWESAINRMVTDHEFRRDCAIYGRTRVEAEYDWNNPVCREPWRKVFETITGVTL